VIGTPNTALHHTPAALVAIATARTTQRTRAPPWLGPLPPPVLRLARLRVVHQAHTAHLNVIKGEDAAIGSYASGGMLDCGPVLLLQTMAAGDTL